MQITPRIRMVGTSPMLILEQIRYVTMSARLIIGCLALVVVSLLYAVLPPLLTAAVSLPLLAIALVLMVNVEKLPIWEER